MQNAFKAYLYPLPELLAGNLSGSFACRVFRQKELPNERYTLKRFTNGI
jgi:hypothetical protein